MDTKEEKKKELRKLLKSITLSGSSFEAAELSEEAVAIAEELTEDSGVVQVGPEESD